MEEIKEKIEQVQKKANDHLYHFHAFGQDSCEALAYVKCLQRIEVLKKRLENV